MATADQISWLRSDVGTNEIGLPDVEAEALFTRAAVISSVDAIQESLTRIYYLRGLLSSSAKLTTYRQNQTQENISDIFEHVKYLLQYWEKTLELAYADEAAGADSGVRSGRQTKYPTRMKEYPDYG
jgi:hypothetical protein